MRLALLLLASAAATAASPPPTPAALLDAARSDAAWLARVRATLHAIPELGYDLPLTSARVKAVLKELGVASAAAKGAAHGVVATVGAGEPVFALRADMDALPIEVRGAGGGGGGGPGVMGEGGRAEPAPSGPCLARSKSSPPPNPATPAACTPAVTTPT